jgi:hypothetical protein
MSNCQVSHSKKCGVAVNDGLITMNGSGTSIDNNVTGGSSGNYGLHTWSSSSILNNGGGGNYGGNGTIKTI